MASCLQGVRHRLLPLAAQPGDHSIAGIIYQGLEGLLQWSPFLCQEGLLDDASLARGEADYLALDLYVAVVVNFLKIPLPSFSLFRLVRLFPSRNKDFLV